MGKQTALDLSVIILARDAAETIGEAVSSARGLGRILVIDSGSRDETVDIARKAGAEIVEREWPGYAAQRQWAIDNVKSEWILFLDADEALTPELAREIGELQPGPWNGFRIPRRNQFLGEWISHGTWGRDTVLRLFRRSQAEVPPRAIHETVEVAGRVGRLEHPLLHFAQNDFRTIAEKLSEYVTPMAEEILKKKGSGNISTATLMLRPAAAFFKDYVIHAGFLDGWRGFVLAFWQAASVLAKYAEARRLIEWNAKSAFEGVTPLRRVSRPLQEARKIKRTIGS
ncbi:MAG: glycosyltransferase family 2 protein [Candidatus Hydrogenedentota bacterium]|nr:MAG: glycosyltransferase family 2 protein [Candidatus Hydrogenedentota bacterium]